jgi:hypothetical protein
MMKMRPVTRPLPRRPARRDRADAFLPDPASGAFVSLLPDAEEYIASVTGGDSVLEEARNELSLDELVPSTLSVDPMNQDEELEFLD